MKSPNITVARVQALVGVVTVVAGFAVLPAACATAPPAELVSARSAFTRASAGPAAQLAPADLRRARLALDQAERTFAKENDSVKTADFAYLAERTAQIAEAHAQTAISEKSTVKATRDLGDRQGEIAKQTAGTLTATRAKLADAERGEAEEAQQIGVERTAREAAEQKADASEQKADASERKAGASANDAAASELRAQQANDALAKLSAKADERGMVIVLSGSVLFRSNGVDLLPAALLRLDEVAEALAVQDHNVVVEGYTDSRGSHLRNVELSQRRAETVRKYLIFRGCPTAKITARGLGPDRPVADNTNSEGRANNRRVEIVINRP